MNQLERARTSRGWTQQRLIAEMQRQARSNGLQLPSGPTLKAQVSRWENGHQQPDRRYRQLLRLCYGIDDVELGFKDPSPAHDHLNRPSLTESLEGSLLVDEGSIATASVQTDQLRALDRKLGARQVLHQTRALADAVERWLRYSTSTGRRARLASVLADCSALAGWQALDVGQPESAWSHFETAKAAAREAQDRHLEAWAGGEQAYVLSDIGRHKDAIGLLEHYRFGADGRLSPLMACWLAAASAELAARAGHVTSARRALDQAQLTNRTTFNPQLAYVVLDESHLTRWRGHVLAQLGDEAATDELSRAAKSMPKEFVRAHASLNTDLAIAYLRLGNQELAQTHASTARQLARQIGSTRVARRLANVAA